MNVQKYTPVPGLKLESVIKNYEVDGLYLRAHLHPVSSAVLLSEKNILITSSQDPSICIWNLHDSLLVHRFHAHNSSILKLSVTKTRTKLISYSIDRHIKIWNLPSYELQAQIQYSHLIFCFEACQIETVLVYGSIKGKVRFWKFQSQTENIQEFQFNEDSILTMAVSNNDSFMAVGSFNKNLYVMDIESYELKGIIKHTSQILSICITNDSQKIITSSFDQDMQIFTYPELELTGSLQRKNAAAAFMKVSEDNRLLHSFSFHSGISLWDLTTNSFVSSCSLVKNSIKFLHFERNEYFLLTFDEDHIELWNASKKQIFKKFKPNFSPICFIAINKDNDSLVSVDKNLQLFMWDCKNKNIVAKANGVSLNIESLSRKGKYLVCSDLVACKVWKIELF